MQNSHTKFMHRAIELAKEGALIKKTGGPFGAVIVKDNKIIGEGYNQVLKRNDPTWHGEMHAIREACKLTQSPHLDGAILYTSSEPCPMCLGAAYWAHIKEIYYASTVDDALQYGDFQDFDMYREFQMAPHERKIKIYNIMRQEAVDCWLEFATLKDKARY
jgi:tRNA(Arg) A34 adenosine deaminase TadA